MRDKVMYEFHGPPYAMGHRGIQATLKGEELNFYWPTTKKDITTYVSTCVVCQKVKSDKGKQPRLMQPLPIPNAPWEITSMDFIFGLLISIQGSKIIWTIADWFNKLAHFIPIKKTIKTHHIATLFIS